MDSHISMNNKKNKGNTLQTIINVNFNFQANNNKLEMIHGREKFKLQNIFEEIMKKEDIIKICKNDLESKSNYNSRSV